MSFNFKLYSLLFTCHALYCKTLHFPGSLNPLSSGFVWSVRSRGGRLQSRVNGEARVLQFSHPVHLMASLDPTRNSRPPSLGHGWLRRVVQALFPVPNLRLNSLFSYASEHTWWKQFLSVTNFWIVSSSSAWPFLSSISCTTNFLNQFESLGEVSIFLSGPWLYTYVSSIKHNYELLWEMANLTWMCISF